MSLDKILDLTAGVYFQFYYIYMYLRGSIGGSNKGGEPKTRQGRNRRGGRRAYDTPPTGVTPPGGFPRASTGGGSADAALTGVFLGDPQVDVASEVFGC